jgi:hypothetical protein
MSLLSCLGTVHILPIEADYLQSGYRPQFNGNEWETIKKGGRRVEREDSRKGTCTRRDKKQMKIKTFLKVNNFRIFFNLH